MLITTKNRKIHYISNLYIGREHDYSILKAEFPANMPWFEDKEVHLDLGFQGFQDTYTTEKTYLPHKKKRTKKGMPNELSEEQKNSNKEQAKHRVVVEHSIGGMKRFSIIKHQINVKSIRSINTNVINTIIGVCAGLWNFLIH